MNEKGHLALGTTYTKGLVVGIPNKIHTTVTSYRKIFEKENLQNNNNLAMSVPKREDIIAIIAILEERRNTTLKCIDQAEKDLQFTI